MLAYAQMILYIFLIVLIIFLVIAIMDSLMSVYHREKRNVDALQNRLRFPIAHGYNLPSTVDLRKWMTITEDQDGIDTCVANSIADSLEYLYRRYTGRRIDVSQLFIDYNARRVNRDWTVRQGLAIDPYEPFGTNREAAIRAVQKYGFCIESIWPYTEDLFKKRPQNHVYHAAAQVSIIPLKVPIHIVSVKTCLAHGIPVLVGIHLSPDETNMNQGYVKIPQTAPTEGLHSCLVVGYNDHTEHFILRNSWGPQWGDQGYCYVPYQYLIDERLVADGNDGAFWAIPEIVPREMMIRGSMSYPNFTHYNQQYMLLSLTDKSYQQQRHKHRHRRRRHY